MSKPMHPIRKMLRDLDLPGSAEAPASDRDLYQRAIARDIKPLLDALEREHGHVEHGPCSGGLCTTCRLLAAWREKL